MNRKMATKSQLLTTEQKTKQNKKLSKQLEQEQNHRNRDHIEGCQWGEEGEWRGKVQGIRSIISRHKIDKGKLKIV